MKSLEEIIQQHPVFLHEFHTKEDVFREFELSESETDEINILFASYGTGNYEGDAFVLFEKDGKLYEVNGGHCSCYGLEGQWREEEVELMTLYYRLTVGKMGVDPDSGNNYANELKEFLGIN